MTRRQQPQVDLLPDDVLADEVLRRAGASPRALAVCHCVCRAWRAIIDDRRLLRADLLPRSLAGLVADYTSELPYAEFFARPSVDPWDYGMPRGGVADHCNGLLLVDYDWVYNPATGGYATLPEPPAPRRTGGMEDLFIDEAYLVFDPAVSPPHYEVLVIPRVPTYTMAAERLGSAMLCSEWPPSPCVLRVFSSTTGLWEERSFARQGEAAGTVADMLLVRDWLFQLHAEYWRGALYVQCQTQFVMRISLSTSTYRVTKPPSIGTDDQDEQEFPHPNFFLGRSEQGIYYALLDLKDHRLRVWILDESCDRIEWRLRHDTGRGLVFPSPSYGDGPWILSNSNYDDSDDESSEDGSSEDDDEEAQVGEQEFEWNSDDDNALPTDNNRSVEQQRGYVLTEILAFHPYREIVFLHRSNRRALTYVSFDNL
ncbi:hypothetical protein BS78_06G236200 [Paspalum vaginatum]|nr:hypothetical protein BS78_06G236200 [Paspalum vaginatum]